MDAIIKIPSSEFNEDLFKKITLLLNGRQAEIIIAVHESQFSKNEASNDQYWGRLEKSIKDIENGKGVNFTMKELDDFIRN